MDDNYIETISQAATWVNDCLVKSGIDLVHVHNTDRHPIVYGEKIIDSDAPTILIYGHYDVQPADPYDLLESPPFDPKIRNTPLHPEGAIFARGSADDKGQVYMQIKAIEAMIKTGTLSCNVKFIIEGEEEIGSNSLYPFIKENKEKLKADTILVSDLFDIPGFYDKVRIRNWEFIKEIKSLRHLTRQNLKMTFKHFSEMQ